MRILRSQVRSLAVCVPLIAALVACGADRAADPGSAPLTAPSSSAATDSHSESPSAGETGESPYAAEQVVASLEVTGGICGPRCDEQTIVLGDRSWNRSSAAEELFGELDDAQWQALLTALDTTGLDELSLKQRHCPGVADYRTVTYGWTVGGTTAEVAVCDLAAPADDPLAQWWGTLLSSR